MSTVNVLIGVGGTGAKVVESALVCALAGFGPDDLAVGFVDQDGGNGNVDRSRAMLGAMERFRSLWWTGAGSDQIKPIDGAVGLGSARVRPLSPSDPLWVPHAAGTTLADVFHADSVAREDLQLKALMDVLFTPDRDEQLLELSVGYRGRAHIGSAAFLAAMSDSAPFWQAILEQLKRGQTGSEVRVFLCGSVFGGTGAAGFPTLARKLRDLASKTEGARIRIGGALMLPYFGFGSAEDPNANVAKQEDLLLQSEEALRYYADLFDREGSTFDELYLTGWRPYFQLGYHSRGSASQSNPPLPPELIAATGAMRFFLGQAERTDGRNATFLSQRHDRDRLGWSDLPGPDEARAALPYESLGRLLRFCTAWRHTIRPALKPRMFGGDPWFRKQSCNVNYKAPQTQAALDALDDLVARTLQWAAAQQLYATTGEFGPPGVRGFQLWDVSPQAQFPGTITPEQVSKPVALRDPLPDRAAVDAYERVVWARGDEAKPVPQQVLFDQINTHTRAGDHQGLGRIVDAVFHASAVGAPEREAA